MNGFSRFFLLFFFAIVGTTGCRMLEHTPYYETVDTSAGTGIQKIDRVLPENQAVMHHVTQKATDMWKDSGIQLAKGQYVQIQAKGYWGCQVEHLGYQGPQGQGKDNGLGFPWFSLLGKIGDHGAPFLVSNLCTFVTTASGNLFFVMNDGKLCYDNNNKGEVEIAVALIDPTQVPNAPPNAPTVPPVAPALPTISPTPSAVPSHVRLECRLRLFHVKSGENHGEASAGCTDIGKLADMATFLGQKLEEKSMVRHDRVGILPLRETGDTATQERLGTALRARLYDALDKLAIFRLLDATAVDALLSRHNLDAAAIGERPLGQQLPEIDYLLMGEIISK